MTRQGARLFDIVLTHGFVLDEKGMKMSKSWAMSSRRRIDQRIQGADILRSCGWRPPITRLTCASLF